METGAGRDSTLTEVAREQLRAAILAEYRASWLAAGFALFLWVAIDPHPVLLVLTGVIVALIAVRNRAIPAVDAGRVEKAVVIFMATKWTMALVLVLILPIALPIAVVNLIMPIVIGSTHLSARRFVPLTVAVVVVTFAVGTAGYVINIFELEENVEPWVWQWLCVIVLTFHLVPFSAILWRTNQQQVLTFNEAVAANERLVDSQRELLESRQRLVAASDEERSRIERDLHDGAQQRLTSVLVQLRLQRQLAERGNPVDADAQLAIERELEAAIAELRQLAHGINPPLLEMSGLATALAAVTRRSGHTLDADGEQLGRFDRSVESGVFYCCLEAMQNATKHAGDDANVVVRLERRDDELVGSVRDDGPGLAPGIAPLGRGLQHMSDRISAVGGRVHVRTADGGGTVVEFSVPVGVAAFDEAS